MIKYLFSIFLFMLLVGVNALEAQDAVCYNPNLMKDTTKKSIKSQAVRVIASELTQ